MLDHSPLLYRFETGLLSNEEFYKEVCSKTGYKGCHEEFCGYFGDIFWEIEPMIAWQATLRKKGIPTYIFSNTNGIAVPHIRRKFPFFANFDGYILSYEEGAMKPDPKIYEIVERRTGHKGAEIFYIDDRPENIETAVTRGWQAHLQRDPIETFKVAKSVGLPVN